MKLKTLLLGSLLLTSTSALANPGPAVPKAWSISGQCIAHQTARLRITGPVGTDVTGTYFTSEYPNGIPFNLFIGRWSDGASWFADCHRGSWVEINATSVDYEVTCRCRR